MCSSDLDFDVARTQSLIDQAPAVVDMSPNTQDTPHDRVLRCIGRGTAFLTNRMACFDSVALDPDRYTYDFSPDGIRGLVERYVSRPDEAVELGLEQSRIFRSLYTDERYVATLTTMVDICALRIGGAPEGTQDFVVFPSSRFT